MTTLIFFFNDVSGFLYHDNYSFPFKAGLTEDELCNEPIGSPITTKAIYDITTVKFICKNTDRFIIKFNLLVIAYAIKERNRLKQQNIWLYTTVSFKFKF